MIMIIIIIPRNPNQGARTTHKICLALFLCHEITAHTHLNEVRLSARASKCTAPLQQAQHQGPVSRKSRDFFRPAKTVVKLPSACLNKLIFEIVFNVRKAKRIAKFDGFKHWKVSGLLRNRPFNVIFDFGTTNNYGLKKRIAKLAVNHPVSLKY